MIKPILRVVSSVFIAFSLAGCATASGGQATNGSGPSTSPNQQGSKVTASQPATASSKFPELVGFSRSNNALLARIAVKTGSTSYQSPHRLQVKVTDDHGTLYSGEAPLYDKVAGLTYVVPVSINMPAAAPISSMVLTEFSGYDNQSLANVIVPITNGQPKVSNISALSIWASNVPNTVKGTEWTQAARFIEVRKSGNIAPLDTGAGKWFPIEVKNTDYNDISVAFEGSVQRKDGTLVSFSSVSMPGQGSSCISAQCGLSLEFRPDPGSFSLWGFTVIPGQASGKMFVVLHGSQTGGIANVILTMNVQFGRPGDLSANKEQYFLVVPFS